MVRVVVLTLTLLFIGFILEHLPMPDVLSWLQPPWVALIASLLVMLAPQYFGVWLSIPLGLLLDVEYQYALGTHTLALAVHLTCLLLVLRKLRQANALLSALAIPALILLYQLLLWGLTWMFTAPALPTIWQPVLSSLLVWPWLSGLLRFLLPKLHLR